METIFFKNADFLNNICIKKTRVEFHEYYAERENEGEIVTRSLVFHDVFYRIGCEVRRLYRFRVYEDIEHVLTKPESELITRWRNMPEINFVYTDKERKLSNNLRLTSDDCFHWNVFYKHMGEELKIGTRKAILDPDPASAMAQVIGNKIGDFTHIVKLWEMEKKYQEDRKNYKKNMQ